MTAPRSLADLVLALRVTAGGSRRLLHSGDRSVTAADFLADLHALALAFEARGLEPGHRVALVGANRPEWPATELAIQLLGGISVALDPALPDELLAFVLRNAAPRWVLHDPGPTAERIRALAPSLASPPETLDLEGGLVGWLGEGAARRAEVPLDRLLGRVGPDDPAALVYGGGAEGDPRGARHTHGSLLAHARALAAALEPRDADVVGVGLSLAHPAGRAAVLMAFDRGLEVRLDGAADATLAVLASPALEQLASELGAGGGRVLRWALEVGGRWASARRTGLVGPFLAAERWLADRLVLRQRIAERRLGSLRRLLAIGRVGVGTLDRVEAAGLPAAPSWGLAEAWPVAVAVGSHREVAGAAGFPLAGVELRLAEDAGIELRGPGTMAGYWRADEATAAAVSPDGWLRTGDRGRLVDGQLVVEGRQAERLRLGELEVPVERLEAALEADPRIVEAVVPGGRRPWAAALVRPAAGVGPEDLAAAVAERARRWPAGVVLERWAPLGGKPSERTATGALRRRRFELERADEIAALFREGPGGRGAA